MLNRFLPAGGAFGVGEIEVSQVMAVHEAALSSQSVLSGIMQYEMTSTKSVSFMFNQSLLENLFVAVSFDIVVGCHK